MQGILYRVITGTTVGAFLTDVSDNGRSIVLVAVIFGQLILSLFMGLTVRVSTMSRILNRKKNDTTTTGDAVQDNSSKQQGKSFVQNFKKITCSSFCS